MLRGMSTVSYYTPDLPAAVEWYSDLLGTKPYFEQPGYAEFRVGDYEHELGLIDTMHAPPGHAIDPGGAILYWHVDDVRAVRQRLLDKGAKELEPVTERGHGFVTASVVDPFGNVLGIMQNPHYLEMLGSSAPAS